MGLFTFMPIIIMFVLSGLVFVLVSRGFRQRKRISSTKKRPLFFLFYISILVVGFLVYIVMPNNNLEVLKEYEGEYDGDIYFYDVMDQTRSIEEIIEFKQTEKSYPLTGDELHFTETSSDYYNQNIQMLLVKDPSLTGEFTVVTYKTPFIYEGKDISEFVESTEIGGNDGVVHMNLPTHDTILKMYDYSFPFKQFLDHRNVAFGSSYQISSEQLIVIYIPEDVTPNVAHITGDSIYHIEMITKE